jgi:tetratricopeptide (TPR) repeat protein
MGDFARASAVSYEVLPKLITGSASWIQVVGNLIFILAQSGHSPEALALGQRLREIDPPPEGLSAYIVALSFMGAMYQWGGYGNEQRAIRDRMERVAAGSLERDGQILGWMSVTRSGVALSFDARLWQGRRFAEEGMKAFSEVGADRNEIVPRTTLGEVLAAMGDVPAAIEVMKAGLAGKGGEGQSGIYLRTYLPLVLSKSQKPEHLEEARGMALHTRELEGPKPTHLTLASLALARVALAQGAPAEAETWAREACQLLSLKLPYQLAAQICLSQALLAQGRASEARAEAESGVRLWEQICRQGGTSEHSVSVWLALTEACRAVGDHPAADSALRRALECLQLLAEDLPAGEVRERFLSQVPENARVLQLTRQHAV